MPNTLQRSDYRVVSLLGDVLVALGLAEKLNKEPAPVPVPPKSTFKVLLDPGHSNAEPGARSNDGTAKEEVLNRMQAKLIQAELRAAGLTCEIIDPMVDDLVAIGKSAAGYDLFLSLHHNSYDGASDPGAEVFVLPGADENNRRYAKAILEKVVSATGAINRGVKEASWLVTRTADQYCKGPALLIESYFLNPYNEESAKKRSAAAAEAIAKAVIGLVR
jgi:N-acetylmuramoyl-L-alanine amidase